MPDYEAVIGLETHIQLNTDSKIFCSCSADSWGDPANSNICPICTGLPGVLPALNRAVVEKAVMLAGAVGAEQIAGRSFFARKNYFYPDLPKGYQISQYDEPLARGGSLSLPMEGGQSILVRIEKLHLEEDAGKTIRENGRRLIDFNRCGVPLIEMVTKPDLKSADHAAQYLIRLRQLMRWLDISEGDMEKGQLRCDANVSIRVEGSSELNEKTEIKNINSIDAVREAIETEIARQIEIVRSGGRIEALTLNWDEQAGTLQRMRAKETEADYRYFREPDLLPIEVDPVWRDEILAGIPELPLEKRMRFMDQYGLPEYDAEILTEERSLSEYFERAVSSFSGDPKAVSNWMMNDVLRLLRQKSIKASELQIPPPDLAALITMVEDGLINTSTGKEVLERAHASGSSPVEIVQADGLAQVSDEARLREMALKILEHNPEQVETYRGGKNAIMGWFVGQMMKGTGGKANPQIARQILIDLLDNSE